MDVMIRREECFYPYGCTLNPDVLVFSVSYSILSFVRLWNTTAISLFFSPCFLFRFLSSYFSGWMEFLFARWLARS